MLLLLFFVVALIRIDVQHYVSCRYTVGLPRWLSGRQSSCQAAGTGSVPGWGGFPGGRNGNPFQDSYLGNPVDRGAWWAAVHGVAKELDVT